MHITHSRKVCGCDCCTLLSGKAAWLSMSLLLLEWKCSLCCFSGLRMVVKEASVCRRIFAERTSDGDSGSLTMRVFSLKAIVG